MVLFIKSTWFCLLLLFRGASGISLWVVFPARGVAEKSDLLPFTESTKIVLLAKSSSLLISINRHDAIGNTMLATNLHGNHQTNLTAVALKSIPGALRSFIHTAVNDDGKPLTVSNRVFEGIVHESAVSCDQGYRRQSPFCATANFLPSAAGNQYCQPLASARRTLRQHATSSASCNNEKRWCAPASKTGLRGLKRLQPCIGSGSLHPFCLE